MPVSDLVFRLSKGLPLTASEGDENLRKLRDFMNALESLFLTVLNPDGTLKDDSVGTDSIVDRAVTQQKLAWLANFYGVASGTNIYSLTISPTTDFALGDGSADAFFCLVKFTNANTGPATLNINGSGAKDITKGGTTALVSGDIAAGSIAALVYDGSDFQIIFSYIPPAEVAATTLRPVMVADAVDMPLIGVLGGIDITLTKPSDTEWVSFELTAATVSELSGGAGPQMEVAFTYQTSPEAGTPAGEAIPGPFEPGINYFHAAGPVLATVKDNNSLKLRVTVASLTGITYASGTFLARAHYM